MYNFPEDSDAFVAGAMVGTAQGSVMVGDTELPVRVDTDGDKAVADNGNGPFGDGQQRLRRKRTWDNSQKPKWHAAMNKPMHHGLDQHCDSLLHEDDARASRA